MVVEDNGNLRRRGWAAEALDDASEETLRSLQNGFSVRLIATFPPMTCLASARATEVLSDPALKDFDHIPVTRNGRVIGLVDRQLAKASNCSEATAIHSVMRPLDESILISADDSILSFLEAANESPCLLVIDRRRISGIVTLSDIQKLAARPALFLLVTHFELLMAHLIRESGLTETDWLPMLSKGRPEKVEEKWKELLADNMAIDRLVATEFCDKRDILRKAFADKLGVSKTQIDKDLKRIEWDLRNPIAHAGDITLTRERALEVVEVIKICRQWIERLEESRKRLR